jgi:hypothetical protein
MIEELPEEIRSALAAASRGGARRGEREGLALRLEAGGRSLPVLRIWQGGLAVPAEAAAQLRGHVDLWDGSRHLLHGLIVAAQVAGDEVICAFKRAGPPATTPPRDYSDPAGGTDD